MSIKEKFDKTDEINRRAKFRKAGTLDSSMMANSKYCDLGDFFDLQIPILNLAASGSLRRGMYKKSVMVIAAPPKHFKTSFMMQIMKSFQDKYVSNDPYIAFYDCEGGASKDKYKSRGIDINNVLDHIPFATIDSLRNDIVQKMESVNPEDSVLFCVDSLGAATTTKQLDDAKEGENKADLQRSKTIRDFCRTVGRMAFLKRVPMCIVNHTYQEMGLYPDTKVVGGEGAMYESDNVWIVSKSQEKEGTELLGYKFTINLKFSRYVKEKSKFGVIVHWDKGILFWSGIPELSEEFGYVLSEKKGWYKIKGDTEDKSYRWNDLLDGADGKMKSLILDNLDFNEKVEQKYMLS